METKNHWVLAAILGISASVSQTMLMPIHDGEEYPLLILAVGLIVNAIIFSLLVQWGLRLGEDPKIPTASVLESMLNKNWHDARALFMKALKYGISYGLVLLFTLFVVDFYYIVMIREEAVLESWRALSPLTALAFGVQAVFFQETVFRLFLFNLFASWRKSLRMGNFISSITFGVAHIANPGVLQLGTVTILTVAIVNSIGGFIIGLSYEKQGWESSSITHFIGNFVHYSTLPLFLSLF
ncbi:MAG: CPBP family intramembrane glutamic endopeptidase [Candidatus Bathyarchaeia archaeon]